MLDTSNAEIQTALHAVAEAALLASQVQQEMTVGVLSKDDESPVTVGDFAAQAVVGKLLSETFPDDPLVAEEDSELLLSPEGSSTLERVTEFVRRLIPEANAGQVCRWIDRGTGQPGRRFWTLDPIDGTKGFLRGDQYAVALALIMDGRVELGVMGCPNLHGGCLLAAARGQGCWRVWLGDIVGELEPLHVSDVADPDKARIVRSFEPQHTDVEFFEELTRELRTRVEPVLMDSQAKYALLAAGEGDLLFRLLSPERPNYRENIWDHAAGALIVEEAGGRVTDLQGRPLDFTAGLKLLHNRGLLASNGHLHEAALQVVAAFSGE